MIYDINLNQYFYLKSEIDDLLANIDVGEIYTADNTTINISNEDVISVKPNVFADKTHTHTESQITDLGDYIEKSNTSGLVKNDGTIDTTEYIEEDDFGIQIDEDGILTVVPLSDANVYTGDLYATKTYVDNHLFSGSYDDLTDKPTIPNVSGKLDISQTDYKGKNVVVDDTTGNITFEDKPTIPTVPSASSTTPSADTLNGDVGNGVTWARSNHKHPKSDLYAEASHNHNLTDVNNTATVTVTITYTDDSTETVKLVKYTGN